VTRVAVYTGTFDPLTLGHLDLIRRAATLADRLIVGVATNSTKAPLFSLDERLAAVRREAAALSDTIDAQAFDGLAVDFARSAGATLVVRGLRNATDFDYEAQMATMNATMVPELETVFLAAAPAYAAIASSLVKDVARGGGAIEHFVPQSVVQDIRAKVR
jgi:pantetheine-phosphate adenylyltransferase